ncbi:hypothetical protein ACJJTC_001954 [Scirpophaga incertulas]
MRDERAWCPSRCRMHRTLLLLSYGAGAAQCSSPCEKGRRDMRQREIANQEPLAPLREDYVGKVLPWFCLVSDAVVGFSGGATMVGRCSVQQELDQATYEDTAAMRDERAWCPSRCRMAQAQLNVRLLVRREGAICGRER